MNNKGIAAIAGLALVAILWGFGVCAMKSVQHSNAKAEAAKTEVVQ